MKPTTWKTAAAAAAVLGLAVYALWPDRRPNVLWITIDGLRPDRLPAYGYASTATPNIDYLAAHGVVFENAFTDAPWTTAAVASALTGQIALHHGLRTPFDRLSPAAVTIAERLRDAGYDTAAVVGSFRADGSYGFERGFAAYDDRYDSPELAGRLRPHLPGAYFEDVDAQRAYLADKVRADSYRSDAAVGDAAVSWLERASRMRPFFLWVHFFGPHLRRVLGDKPAVAAEREAALYDDRVRAVDEQIGRVLDELAARGDLGRTLVIVQGAEGESLHEHGEVGHGTRLYDSTLRVPLILAIPGETPARRVAAEVWSVDLAPTVAAVAGIELRADADGRSLAWALHGQAPPSGTGRDLVAETLLAAEAGFFHFHADGTVRLPGLRRLALRDGRWKLIVSEPHPFINRKDPGPLPADAERHRRAELYDLESDPGETVDVAVAHPDVVDEMRRRLEALAGRRRAPAGEPEPGAARKPSDLAG